MHNERRKGMEYSAILHVIALILMIFGLPSFLDMKPPPEPAAITVELLPITGITNVKPTEADAQNPKPEPKTADKPAEETKKQADAKKPAPPVKSASAPPPPAADAVPTPDAKKKPEEKKEEKKDDKKDDTQTKSKLEDLDAVLKAVKDTAKKEQKKEQGEKAKTTENAAESKSISNKYDPSQPLSLSEKDAIMGQLARCWNPPTGAKDAHDLVVVVDAEFNMDGSYLSAVIADESKGRYNSDSFFRAAAEAALRAVRQCSPLQNLPQDKYATWKSMELHFDPRYMLQ